MISKTVSTLLSSPTLSVSSHIFATGVTYLMPVVAIFIGVLDGDDFKFANVPWIIMIIGGVYLLNQGKKKVAK